MYWPYYASAFTGSLALSWWITPMMIRLALRKGVLDQPTAIKGHVSPVPYLGGAAIVVAFSAAVLTANLVLQPVDGIYEVAAILGLGVLLASMGLVDDLRGLGPVVRLVIELAVAVALWAGGSGVSIFAEPTLNLALTVLWVVGIVNAFNLLDNMDGLSAGIASIAAFWFFVLAAVNGQFLVASLSVALIGCALGFLRHNAHPARIYMGDAGSLFLGFVLAVIGMKLRFSGPTQVTFLVPVLVCGVAVFDTTLVTVERLRHGRSPLAGGQDHTSHRLVGIGLTVPEAVRTIYAGGMSIGVLAVVVSRIDRISAWTLAALAFAIGLFAAWLLSRVPVYGDHLRRVLHLSRIAEPTPPSEVPGEHAPTQISRA